MQRNRAERKPGVAGSLRSMESEIPREKEDEEVRFPKERNFFGLFLMKRRQSHEMQCGAGHLEWKGPCYGRDMVAWHVYDRQNGYTKRVCGSDDGVGVWRAGQHIVASCKSAGTECDLSETIILHVSRAIGR